MPERRCCCLTGPCFIYSNELSSDSIPADMEVRSGTWVPDDVDGHLSETGTPNGLIIITLPVVHGDMILSTLIKNATASTRHRIVVNYLNDDNYHYWELNCPAGAMQFWIRAGGVNSLIRSDTLSFNPANIAEIEAHCCIDHFGVMYAECTEEGEALQWQYCGTNMIPGGKYGGIGNGGTAQVDFAKIDLKDHWWHAPPECPWCMCTCGGLVPPRGFKSTFWNAGGCSPLDQVSFEWEIDYTQDQLIYVPVIQPYTCIGETGPCYMYAELHCSFRGRVGDAECWQWNFAIIDPSTCFVAEPNISLISCTCEPHHFVFGPFNAAGESEETPECCDIPDGHLTIEFEEL